MQYNPSPQNRNEMPPTTTKVNDKANTINVKLLLIGNSSVGKSSLLLRFSDEQWLPEDEANATIGVDFRVHKMEVNGKKVKLSIWVRSQLPCTLKLSKLTNVWNGRTRQDKNVSVRLLPHITAAHRGSSLVSLHKKK